jgi:hypothetical protein
VPVLLSDQHFGADAESGGHLKLAALFSVAMAPIIASV